MDLSGYSHGYGKLFKIDLQGNIVDSIDIFKGSDLNIQQNKSVVLNDKIIIAAMKTEDYTTRFIEYDLPSMTLIKSYDYDVYMPEIGKITEDLYYYNNGKEMVYSDYKGNWKYSLPGVRDMRETFETYLWDYPEKYFVGYSNSGHDVYNVTTGEKVIEGNGLELIVVNDHIAAYKQKYADYESEEVAFTLKIYSQKAEIPAIDIEEPNKKWTITFNDDVDERSVLNTSIYVLDQHNERVKDLSFNTIGKQVEVNAPIGGYEIGKTYTLYLTSGVKSIKDKELKEQRTKTFLIENLGL